MPSVMHQIQLRSHQVSRYLFSILGVLLALHLFVVFCHLVLHWRVAALTQIVDLDLEANIPTLFNVSLFFLAAGLFLLGGKIAGGNERYGWLLVAAVLAFLGFDEGSQIHERFESFTMRLIQRADPGQGWLYWAWAIPYCLAGLVLLIALSRWLLKLDRSFRVNLFISGTVYVFGAVFLEWAGSKVDTSPMLKSDALYPWMPCELYKDLGGCWYYLDLRYIAAYTLEEVCEMTGLILCIRAVLKAFEAKQLHLAITVRKDGELQHLEGR